MTKKMKKRQRPPTAWMEHCARKVQACKCKTARCKCRRVSAEGARKICAANWWHRMPRSSKRRAFVRHEPGGVHARKADKRAYCRLCRGPHVLRHGRA